MNKALTGSLIGIVLIGGGLAGGSYYMGSRLEDSYRNSFNLNDKRFAVTLKDFSMGPLSGKAAWTGEITPDLCDPSLKFIVRGEDILHRSLTGYRVESKIYLVRPKDNSAVLLFDTDTAIGWTGDIDGSLKVPAGSHADGKPAMNSEGDLAVTRDDFRIEWQQISGRFKGGRQDGETEIRSFELSMPLVKISQAGRDSAEFELKNLNYYNDIGIGTFGSRPVSGSDKLDIESFSFTNSSGDMRLSNLKMGGTQTADGKTLSYNWNGDIGRFSFGSSDQFGRGRYSIDKIHLNSHIKGLNIAALEKLHALLKRQSQTCVPHEEQTRAMQDFIVELAKSGVSAESKGNQLSFNGGTATVEAQASLPAGDYTAENLPSKAWEALRYSARASIDKKLIREIARLEKKGQEPSDEEIAQAVAEIIKFTGGREEGDKVVISSEKK